MYVCMYLCMHACLSVCLSGWLSVCMYVYISLSLYIYIIVGISCREALVRFASLAAISGTFDSLFKVPFAFPSWYLFAIGLEPIRSFE